MIAWLAAVLVAACALASPAAAQMPTRAAIDAACNPGADPQVEGDESYPGGLSPRSGGLTPQYLPGATTISAREAKCIVDRFGKDVLVLAAMEGEERLPDAVEASIAASADASLQAAFATAMEQVSGPDKTRPIIVYCHHERCFLSYNVALRAAQAGYRNVFWMRPGIAAWKAAGYPVVAPPPPPPAPGAVTVSDRLRNEIARCREQDLDYTAEDWANIVHQIADRAEQDASFVKYRDEKHRWYKLCLENVARTVAGDADKAEIARVLAGSLAEVEAMFDAARNEVETDPARYLTMTWDNHKPEKLRADLEALKGVKTLEQACGTFDFAQPALSNSDSYFRNLNARRLSHAKCIEAYSKDLSWVGKTFGLTSANTWVKATRRFTCAASGNSPRCIPDGPFNAVAEIATDANVAFAKQREKLGQDQAARVNDLMRRGNEWIATLNRRIDEYNARGY